MTLRCKQGDMAIVIHGSKAGMIADVREFVGRSILTVGDSNSVFNDVWAVSYHGQSHDPKDGIQWGCRDAWLLPIRPGDLQETEEKEREAENAG